MNEDLAKLADEELEAEFVQLMGQAAPELRQAIVEVREAMLPPE